jgi:hypothetical protein
VLDHELNVELAARIVDRGERGEELRHDPGFPVQRDHDRINRQPAILDTSAKRLLPASGARRPGEETKPDRGQEETGHR